MSVRVGDAVGFAEQLLDGDEHQGPGRGADGVRRRVRRRAGHHRVCVHNAGRTERRKG